MVLSGAKCFVSLLCTPKQFQPKTSVVRQHLKNEVVSPLTENTLMKENDNYPTAIAEPSDTKIKEKTQQSNMVLTPDVSKQFQVKSATLAIKQQLKDEVVSSLAGNIFDHKRNDNDSITSQIQNPSREVKGKDQDCNMVVADISKLFQANTSTMKIKQYLKKEIVCPLSENILPNDKDNNSRTPMIENSCGDDEKKGQQCEILLEPTGFKKSKPEESIRNKEHNFSENVVPTLSGKIYVAMQARFNLGEQTEKKVEECKIRPKYQSQGEEDSAKRNFNSANHSNVSDSKSIESQQTKPKR